MKSCTGTYTGIIQPVLQAVSKRFNIMKMNIRKMSGFDVDNYPDGTDKVLVAIYLDGPHGHGEGLSRREIADATGLSYQKVRTRVNQLVKENHLTKYPENGYGTKQTKWLYSLNESVKEYSAGVAESFQLFDQAPDEFEREHIMAILSEISRLKQSEDVNEIGAANIEELNMDQEGRRRAPITERLRKIEEEINRVDKEMEDLHNRTDLLIEERLDMEGVNGGAKPSCEKAICTECLQLKLPYVLDKVQLAKCRDCYFDTEGVFVTCDICFNERRVHATSRTGELICIKCLADPLTRRQYFDRELWI